MYKRLKAGRTENLRRLAEAEAEAEDRKRWMAKLVAKEALANYAKDVVAEWKAYDRRKDRMAEWQAEMDKVRVGEGPKRLKRTMRIAAKEKADGRRRRRRRVDFGPSWAVLAKKTAKGFLL